VALKLGALWHRARIALRHVFVEGLGPDLVKKRIVICVTSHRGAGLALRVQPTGAKSWNVIYSRHGRPR